MIGCLSSPNKKPKWNKKKYQRIVAHFYMSRQGVCHYSYVILGTMASQITSASIVYSTVSWGTDQRKHQSSASLASVRGIHRDLWIPAQKASNAENVSIWWRQHGCGFTRISWQGFWSISPISFSTRKGFRSVLVPSITAIILMIFFSETLSISPRILTSEACPASFDIASFDSCLLVWKLPINDICLLNIYCVTIP